MGGQKIPLAVMMAHARSIYTGKPACVNVLTDPKVTSPATLMFAGGFKF